MTNDDSDDDAVVPTLWLRDIAEASVTTPPAAGTDAKGYRTPYPAARIGRDSVYWEGIPFPADWAGSNMRGTFGVADIYIDPSSVGDERLEATVDMAGATLRGDEVLSAEPGPVSVARIDQALDVMFDEDVDDNKANDKINACDPAKFTRTFRFEEGYRDAWMGGNDILLTVSSGTISAKDKDPFDVTDEGGRPAS